MSETTMFQVRKNGLYSKNGTKWLGRENMDSIREQILAERDKELGRWRDPVEKNATVYRMGACLGSRRIMISNELNGASEEVLEIALDECVTDWSKGIAERYFAAHPIKKPWHTPKHLEIWALTIQGCPSEAYIYREGYPNREPAFRPVNHEDRVRFAPTDPKIVDAHRIWPES